MTPCPGLGCRLAAYPNHHSTVALVLVAVEWIVGLAVIGRMMWSSRRPSPAEPP